MGMLNNLTRKPTDLRSLFCPKAFLFLNQNISLIEEKQSFLAKQTLHVSKFETKLMSCRHSLSIIFQGCLHDDCMAANSVSFHPAIVMSVIRGSDAVWRFVLLLCLPLNDLLCIAKPIGVSSKFLYTVPLCVNEVVALRTVTNRI